MKLISIVLPVHNAENFLERCINSILKQSYCEFEVIAINDDSTDNSLDILNYYSNKDNRIRVFSCAYRNVSQVRNMAMDYIRGEYVTFVDADDWCEEAYLLELVKAIENCNSDISICGCREIDNKKVTIRRLEKIDQTLADPLEGTDNLISFHAENDVMGACWCKLYKVEIIKEYNIKHSVSAVVNSDIIFNMEYLLYCRKITFVEAPLYNYVKYSSSLSSKRDPKALDTIGVVIKEKMAVLERSGLSKEKITVAISHWRVRALAFACFREIKNLESFSFSERKTNILVLGEEIEQMFKFGNIDKSRLKKRTLYFIYLTFMLNKITLPIILVPFLIRAKLTGNEK